MDVIYTDFAKTCDKIDHNILATKLYKSSFPNPFLANIIFVLSKTVREIQKL